MATMLSACTGTPHPDPELSLERPVEWGVDSSDFEVAADLRASIHGARARPIGALGLSGGRTAVLDTVVPRVLYFSRAGTLERVVELSPPGAPVPAQPTQLVHVGGDTLGVLARGRAFVLDERGEVIRIWNARAVQTLGRQTPVVYGLLSGGFLVVRLIGEEPSPAAPRWVDSLTVVVVDSGMGITHELGRWPNQLATMRSGEPLQVLFGPQGILTTRDSVVYFGFGDDYLINAYARSGRILGSFRRPWTRVDVTAADIDAFIEGWSKHWIKGSPETVEREKREMRSDPFFPYVPAFSEVLAASGGELWVRSPNLTDAQSERELYSTPLVASRWTIFDRQGRWIGEVTLPPFSHLRDVNDGTVLTIEHGAHAGKVLRRKLKRVKA